ncbi:MAG: hypothetical protein WBE22_06985 [Halobacteriota archaeon]
MIANTIGTYDATVKFHVVRSVEKVNFCDEKEISFALDWNNQSNGCYLTASIYFCPTVMYLYTEGWPEQRTGRYIAYQRIKIVLDNKSLKIVENGKEIYCTPSHGLEFTAAYLYLQMSSHSNYPAREIYLARTYKRPPKEIALDIVNHLPAENTLISHAVATGPYINFYVNDFFLHKSLQKITAGLDTVDRNMGTIIIEHTSANASLG